ncbi:isochorismatase hydrolase [Chthoniobacter flavus Ellin428]|uniref:Isochorismatase hydrolase n=1 Tax=Chthoniobacter flavus Ellin428 TaxID=497964 RepID=B4D2T5_9BACT|nr:isochorismatase family cysteine hydrolase [Chthoniobacter flavus]EDY19046.1 isochorismatase hydrolase [Chthoniobacter flavus Ellin428]TCO86809.1 nicotinamidase-related amidase [Chthoniobacter flavus]
MKTPRDPHGVAPDKSEWALLLIDVINDFDFPEGPKLLRFALPAARRLVALKKRAHRAGVPAIYVNDNFGRWRSDFRKQVARCVDQKCPGSPIAKLLPPADDDYFVLKPKHSGFFSTSLDVLLSHLGARKLILTGFATDICVLFTADDAYMRDYQLSIPVDCSAAETAAAHRRACEHMKRFLKADIRPSAKLRFRAD